MLRCLSYFLDYYYVMGNTWPKCDLCKNNKSRTMVCCNEQCNYTICHNCVQNEQRYRCPGCNCSYMNLLREIKRKTAEKQLNHTTLYKGMVNHEGNPHGIGTEYVNSSIRYKGEFVCGKKSGYGVLYYDPHKLDRNYCGMYLNRAKKQYVGQFVNDTMTGYGTMYDPSGHMVYRGMFSDGKRFGYGVSYDSKGNKVKEGNWRKDKFISGYEHL